MTFITNGGAWVGGDGESNLPFVEPPDWTKPSNIGEKLWSADWVVPGLGTVAEAVMHFTGGPPMLKASYHERRGRYDLYDGGLVARHWVPEAEACLSTGPSLYRLK